MTKVMITRWGDSAAIRLPEAVMQELRLKEGDVVELSLANGAVAVDKVRPKLAPTLAEMVLEMDRLGWENEPESVDWGSMAGDVYLADLDPTL